MKKKTNKVLLIAALAVVVLNLAIIGAGLAIAAHSQPAETDESSIWWSNDGDTSVTVIESDGDGSSVVIDDDTIIVTDDGRTVIVTEE